MNCSGSTNVVVMYILLPKPNQTTQFRNDNMTIVRLLIMSRIVDVTGQITYHVHDSIFYHKDCLNLNNNDWIKYWESIKGLGKFWSV